MIAMSSPMRSAEEKQTFYMNSDEWWYIHQALLCEYVGTVQALSTWNGKVYIYFNKMHLPAKHGLGKRLFTRKIIWYLMLDFQLQLQQE